MSTLTPVVGYTLYTRYVTGSLTSRVSWSFLLGRVSKHKHPINYFLFPTQQTSPLPQTNSVKKKKKKSDTHKLSPSFLPPILGLLSADSKFSEFFSLRPFLEANQDQLEMSPLYVRKPREQDTHTLWSDFHGEWSATFVDYV